MFEGRVISVVVATAVAFAAAIASGVGQAQHACDALGDAGWTVVPTVETAARVDGAPYQSGAGGSWFVDRTTTLLPMCSYYNTLGVYSLRSYTLSPETRTERIGICQGSATGGSVAIAPYAGPCPPR